MNFLGHKPASDDLQFSAAESFRLCTQGLRFLEQYESSTSPDSLNKAEEDLSRCVALYPSDVLPKFYLGSVKTLRGYEGLEEAKLLFNQVIEQAGPSLSFAAKYNLAVANVEEYSIDGFSEAEKLLRELITSKPSNESSKRMVWSAQAVLLYVRADRLWRNRTKPSDDDHATALQLQSDQDAFESKLKDSPFRDDREIWSDELNARGTLQEFLYYASTDTVQKSKAAENARFAFQKAAELKVDYVNSMSNLARLTQDVFEDRVGARQIWERLLKMGKSTQYIRYNLGKIDEAEGNIERAREHYEAAPKIPEAKAALERLSIKRAS
jgi:predicted Zn-dependent protease